MRGLAIIVSVVVSAILVKYASSLDPDADTKTQNDTSSIEGDLLRALLDNGYDKRLRPVVVPNRTLNVNVSLTVFNLVDMDEKSSVLTTSTWLALVKKKTDRKQTYGGVRNVNWETKCEPLHKTSIPELTKIWHDHRLKWDPEKHGGLRFFTFDINDVWVPKIFLQNSAGEGAVDPSANGISRVSVAWDGTMILDSPGIIKSLCDVNIERFPFDTQTCSFRFTTQNVPDYLVHLQVGRGFVQIKDAATWELQNPLKNNEYVFQAGVISGGIHYSYVEFFLTMRRLPKYYLYTVGLPSTAVTILALFTFWLPADCGEKLSFVVSLMLGLTVFQLVVADTLPETSADKQPLLMTFLLFNLIMVAVVLLMTCVTITIHSSRRKIKTRRLRKLLLDDLPRLVCVQTVPSLEDGIEHTDVMVEENGDGPMKEGITKPELPNVVDTIAGKSAPKLSPTLIDPQMTDFMIISEILDRIFFIFLLAIYLIGVFYIFTDYLDELP